MPALREFARDQLAIAEQKGLRRRMVQTERTGPAIVRRAGRDLVSFSCNDYLNLAHHPRVIAAATRALNQQGAGAGASRLVTGNHPAYGELESLLAQMKQTERALVFSSGYAANVGTIPALVGRDDLILIDRLAHACQWDGARLSGATVLRFEHNDVENARELLKTHRQSFGRCLILTETVFSMDGDLGPIDELRDLASRHDAWLMTDDAHGLGLIPPRLADLQMGTLSKAVGVAGGYVCGPSEVVAYLENRARTLMFSTGLPPSNVAAAAEALKILRDDPDLCARPIASARRFTSALGRPPAASPIVPVVLGEPERAMAASAMLEQNGLLVVAIRPPSVPPGTARLRFAFSASLQVEDIDRAAGLLKEQGYA